MSINEIALRRKNLILLEKLPSATSDLTKEQYKDGFLGLISNETKNLILAATIIKNMESLGYTVNKELLDKMVLDTNITAQINEYVIPELVKLKGADVKYTPMYPDFPKQVMEMEEAELYLNALIHYFSFGHIKPEYNEEKRPELNEKVKLTSLEIGTDKNITELFSNILNSATPWTPQDRDDILELSSEYDLNKAMPKAMTNRENIAILTSMLAEKDGVKAMSKMKTQIKTVTDVLRVMNVRHGDGDASLAGPVKIKNMSRLERKIYLDMIEKCKDAAEDMKINKIQWVKVGEKLHPGEFKDKYPKAFDAFNNMRDKSLLKTVETFNAKVENAIRSNDAKLIKKALSDKPGMMARNLDRLLRDAENTEDILKLYDSVANKISPNLLWQVYAHFDRKIKDFNEENRMRIFVIKGEKSKTVVKKDETTPIPVETCEKIKELTEKALKDIYKDKPAMGKVYISPEIKGCKVPNETRGASKGMTSIGKGSRMSVAENANIIRGFIWWTNLKDEASAWDEGRVDIDLSAAMLDKNFSLIDRIAYYNLKNSVGCHSGDITNGGNFDGEGVAEFLDINIPALKKENSDVKYIAFTVNSYNDQPYSEMEHVRFGFMEREKVNDGQIFEPATVKQSVKLSANSTAEFACLYDVDANEMIWVDDIAYGDFRSYNVNNIDTNMAGMSMAAYKAVHMEKAGIGDVVRVNVEARGGEIVENKEDADLIFALDGDVKPYDLEYFSGNLIPKTVSKEYEIVNGQKEKLTHNEKSKELSDNKIDER